MITTTKTPLTPIEETILNIIIQEPNITNNLIKTTANHQGINITKNQLQKTLQNLVNKNLVKEKEQLLARNSYRIYTIT
ncbi:hypothetical protein KQH65_06315 [archaeon]|nr:hypothetical protein [archaeon]